MITHIDYDSDTTVLAPRTPVEIIDSLIRLSLQIAGISEILAMLEADNPKYGNIYSLLCSDTKRISDASFQYCEILQGLISHEGLDADI